MVAQPERAKSVSNPAQAFSGRMRIGRVQIGSFNNLAHEKEFRVADAVLLENRIERDVFAMMTQLAVWNVEYSAVLDGGPIGVLRQKNELGTRIDEPFNQPRTRNPVHLNAFARNPFHSF